MPIRPLRPTDLPAVYELDALAQAEGFRFVRRFVDDLRTGDVRLDAEGEFFVGAVTDGRLLAIGGVTPDPYLRVGSIGRLRHLYVRPDARGAGVGRSVVRHLERRAAARYCCLRLRTDTAQAARFYTHLGYHAVESDSATHARELSRSSGQQPPTIRCS